MCMSVSILFRFYGYSIKLLYIKMRRRRLEFAGSTRFRNLSSGRQAC